MVIKEKVNNNTKYILIIGLFIFMFILYLITQSPFINIFAPLVTIILVLYLFREEILKTNFNQLFTSKTIYENSYNAFVACMLGQAICNILFTHLTILQDTPTITTSVLVTLIPIVPFYTILISPIVEEIIFRKIIFGSIQKNKQKFSILAAIISSLLFASAHMNLTYFAGYFVVGMALCYYYYSSRTLYTSILAHIYLNFTVIFFQSLHIITKT